MLPESDRSTIWLGSGCKKFYQKNHKSCLPASYSALSASTVLEATRIFQKRVKLCDGLLQVAPVETFIWTAIDTLLDNQLRKQPMIACVKLLIL